jgi:hypothetical protein
MTQTFTSYSYVSSGVKVEKPLTQGDVVPANAQWLNTADQNIAVIITPNDNADVYIKGQENIPDLIQERMTKEGSKAAVIRKDQNDRFEAYLDDGDKIVLRDVDGQLKTIFPEPVV